MNYDYLADALSPPMSQSVSPPHSSSTLCFSNLEPWMDEEYAKRLCSLMGWEGVTVKIPTAAPDPATGHTVNNPGYCFLTFASPARASAALSQVMPTPSSSSGAASSPIMPNSSRPYAVSWASPAALSSLFASQQAPFLHAAGSLPPPQPKEYSIFVGDLAPEASNSDLVAVFRNPMLGLRSDREPKFIRPFYSCKSAKIQLDPVTGLSKGYGFVRFTDQAEQQRALIEMHGLYCLSRPMRISPATAKSKAPAYPGAPGPNPTFEDHQTKDQRPAFALPSHTQTHTPTPSASLNNNTNSRGSIDISPTIMEQIASLAAQPSNGDAGNNGDTHASITAPLAARRNGFPTPVMESPPPPPPLPPQPQQNDEWRQTHALLGSLMGPNGEQITSADPYNTTVFVGGLSPLVPEETLRTFFAPFGEIHYVKVPVGKHCGFVQFVHKADAERAIEKMQGFPIGGSKIRLSWGRSQYKAVQAAAAQAVAAAAAAVTPTALPPPPPPVHSGPPPPPVAPATMPLSQADIIAQIAARQGGSFTPEQAAILLQLGYGGWQANDRRNAPTPPQQQREKSAALAFSQAMSSASSMYSPIGDDEPVPSRLSNSVSLPALGGQGFTSPRTSARPNNNANNAPPLFAPFGNGNANAYANSDLSSHAFQSYGHAHSLSNGGASDLYLDRERDRDEPGARFQISDLLRQDSQPLPRSLAARGAGAIGNKSSVDGISAAMASMSFGRPASTSIWSQQTSSISPTLARARGSPHSSVGSDA